MQKCLISYIFVFFQMFMTTFAAGSVTINGPAINRLQQARQEIVDEKDNERRICFTCHGLHKAATTDKQLTIDKLTSKPALPGKTKCTYKKMKGK